MRVRGALVAALVVGCVALGVELAPRARTSAVAPTTTAATVRSITPATPLGLNPKLDAGDTSALPKPDLRSVTFQSAALGRAMPYLIYLPPGYTTTTARYPVLYMLHGMSGTNDEWRGYGLIDTADKMIRSGAMRPLIIVLPQGDQAYWVDHAAPTDRTAWGRYMAKDVVGSVDAGFRTMPDAADRAIGGVSMGAHGAVQLAMNYPGEFSVVGAHSLVLRRYDTAPAYFGSQSDWAKRDPMQLVYSKVDTMRGVDLWIDIGAADPWAKLAEQFNRELNTLKVAHQWHEWSGDHSASYWRAHLVEYLRFYDTSLASHETAGATEPLRPI
ncbi:MAG TPA: alpha/beta hydrolase-fold protein [Candidatus Limnocylindria bacterium]